MSDLISRRTLAKGAAWAVPAVAVASAAPAFATSFIFQCPTTSCLQASSGSAPSFTTSTPDGGASTYMNWTMGTFTQTCITDPNIAWYWFFCPTKIVANTKLGHSYTGTFSNAGPCSQTNSTLAPASPTVGVTFTGYPLGYKDCFNLNNVTGNLNGDYITSITLTYYLQFVDPVGTTVSTTTGGTNCPYTVNIPVTQNGTTTCGLLSGGGTVGQIPNGTNV